MNASKAGILEVRMLAIKLFEAARTEKIKQGEEIWGRDLPGWHYQPSESVAMWEAVARCAMRQNTPVRIVSALMEADRAISDALDPLSHKEINDCWQYKGLNKARKIVRSAIAKATKP